MSKIFSPLLKNFFLILLNIVSSLVILSLVLIALISTYPSNAIKIIDKVFINSAQIDFSGVTSSGNLFYPTLYFDDLKISINKEIVFESKYLKSSFKFLYENPFELVFMQPFSHITISEGSLQYFDEDERIKIFDSINADIAINSSHLINGYLHLSQKNKMGSIFLASNDKYQKYIINLPNNNWLSNFPTRQQDDLKEIKFSLNLIGNNILQSWNTVGSFSGSNLMNEYIEFSDLSGEFTQTYFNKIAFISFNNLNKPLLKANNVLAIDFLNKTLRLSDIYLDHDFVNLESLQNIEKIQLNNLSYIANNKDLFFSANFNSLNINNIYLESLKGISGIMLANNDFAQLKIKSNGVLEAKNKANFIANIQGDINYDFKKLELSSQLLFKINNTELDFRMTNFSKNKYKLNLVTENIDKKLFIALLPDSLTNIQKSLQRSLISNYLDNLMVSINNTSDDPSFNYISGSATLNNFEYKINSDSIVRSDTLDLILKNNDLKFYLGMGDFNSIPFQKVRALIETDTGSLYYYSDHTLTQDDLLIDAFSGVQESLQNNFSLPIETLGIINLMDSSNVNFAVASLNNLDLDIYKDMQISNINGNIYLNNFNNAYGVLNLGVFNQDLEAIIAIKNLNKNPSISLSSKLLIDMASVTPKSDLFNLQGKELSDLTLTYSEEEGIKISMFNNLKSTKISSQIEYFNKDFGQALDTNIEISNITSPNIFIKNTLFETLIIIENNKLGGYFKSGNYFDEKIASALKNNDFNIYLDIPQLDFEDLSFNDFGENSSAGISIKSIEFYFDKLILFGNIFNSQSGKFTFSGNTSELYLKGDDLNGLVTFGAEGFTKINLNNSSIKTLTFPESNREKQSTNMRIIGKNIDIDGINIDAFDFYILENSEVLTVNDIKVKSKNINVEPLNTDEKAYISYNKNSDLYKVKGIYELKNPPKEIQKYLNYNFEYLKSNMNIEWTSAKQLNNLQGKLSFLVKDLKLDQEISNSVLLKALGIFNLKSFFSTLSEIDLSDENRNNLNIRRGAGGFIFMNDKARISDPLFIETNFAKMKWIGDIQKDRRQNLSDLDLFLEMRLTISDNLPWYGAFLGGFPAIAGGMVIGSIFEEGINEISTLNYQVKGDINNPELIRLE